MASWATPTSAAFTATCRAERLPRVDPPGMSEWLAKVWREMPARSASTDTMAAEAASVVYFWLPLYLTTTPPPSRGRFTGSLLSGRLGCRAWTLSADSRKLWGSFAR